MTITVATLRRYPVKSMGGEDLDTARFDARGLTGDRWYAVEDEHGRFASGKDTHRFRRRDAVFDYSATSTDDTVTVHGPEGRWVAGDPALDAALSRRMKTPVRVTAEGDVSHQDAGGVSLIGTATLAWCARRWDIDADPRRLRVNLVLDTDEPFIEEQWAGRTLRIGEVALTVTERIPRCRTIDIDQDGARARGRWLKPLAAECEMSLAMYAEVASAGSVSVSDEVRIAPA